MIKQRSQHHTPAVIFDLDGTLIDSAADICRILNLVLTGITPSASLAQVRSWIGEGARALVTKALDAADCRFDAALLDRLTADFVDAYAREPVIETRPYPQAMQVLANLRALGVALGVCTNKPETVAGLILERCGLKRLVQSLVGGGSGFAPKPDPAGLVHCVAELKRSCAKTIFVGDSAIDLQTARAAGCACILISHGYSREPLESIGADACVASFAELPDALIKFFPGEWPRDSMPDQGGQ